ncbi:helix-turn-helix domain-containing protein [Dactylosporangium sp. NPDC051541]|uniref:helix-turn-helix domain-containing protein n=1 Tax=Dactylosporangium sp. NPDC051541 TaxID=3363977 RepID=UPI003791B08D
MGPSDSPAGAQRCLRLALRQFRDAVHYTKEQVADALGWSLSKVQRIEVGAWKRSETVVRFLPRGPVIPIAAGMFSTYFFDDAEGAVLYREQRLTDEVAPDAADAGGSSAVMQIDVGFLHSSAQVRNPSRGRTTE